MTIDRDIINRLQDMLEASNSEWTLIMDGNQTAFQPGQTYVIDGAALDRYIPSAADIGQPNVEAVLDRIPAIKPKNWCAVVDVDDQGEPAITALAITGGTNQDFHITDSYRMAKGGFDHTIQGTRYLGFF